MENVGCSAGDKTQRPARLAMMSHVAFSFVLGLFCFQFLSWAVEV